MVDFGLTVAWSAGSVTITIEGELKRHEADSRKARSHGRELAALKERFLVLQGQDDRRQPEGTS